MIDRYPIIACILTLLLVGYLCFALPATANMAKADTYAGCKINVTDTLGSGFVSQLEVSQECGDIMQWISTKQRREINLNELENTLRASDKIESVNVCVLNNGVLSIDVIPMQPVARVFDDKNAKSYYINAEGKRISADPQYHIDVPIVVGHFTTEKPAARLLPLLEYIADNPEIDALVSTVKQNSRGDIIIVPAIRGHVINFGNTDNIQDKFTRLREFYRQALPVRGWNTYDTISVKWNGSVVATRRNKALTSSSLASAVEEFDDIDDRDTMMSPLHTDSVPLSD